MGTFIYLDTSASAKLFVREAETGNLRDWLSERTEPVLVSSSLMAVELLRLLRLLTPATAETAAEFLDQDVDLYTIQPHIREAATHAPPPRLRTLDAIHLATALDLEEDLDFLVTYDKRLAEAAREAGLQVVAPGAG